MFTENNRVNLSLDLVLRLSHGAALVPLKRAAQILGIAEQTIRNQLSQGAWPSDLPVIKMGCRNFFLAQDLAKRIAGAGHPSAHRGAPKLSERQAAATAGLTVSELRREQKNG